MRYESKKIFATEKGSFLYLDCVMDSSVFVSSLQVPFFILLQPGIGFFFVLGDNFFLFIWTMRVFSTMTKGGVWLIR